MINSSMMKSSMIRSASCESSYVKRITANGGFWTNHNQNPSLEAPYEMDVTEGYRCGKLYYRCRHKETQKDCVVKKIEKPDAYNDVNKVNDPGIMELKIMERISQDPDISHLVDLFEDEKFVYLVVENMRGGNIMKRKGLNSEKKIAEIFFKMVELFKNLHETGVV